MKTACTAFITLLFATSCAKEFDIENSTEINNEYITGKGQHTLSATTNIINSISFEQEHNFTIPDFIEVISGEALNNTARIYFDYSALSNEYAYFCRYYPSKDLSSLEFDNCFTNKLAETQYDSIPRTHTQLVFSPGYLDFIKPGNSIVLEVSNAQNQNSVNVEVQLEID